MPNTLYLPELREMLADNNEPELSEFCTALHPARTAEFMEGLTADEAWRVLSYAPRPMRIELFRYLDLEKQVAIIETVDRSEMAPFVSELPADERVDILSMVSAEVVEQLLPLLPVEERRDILRLGAYPEGTAGSLMTTEFARLDESFTVGQALEFVRKMVEELETIYYLYVVDDQDHLRGLVSLRQLVLAKSGTSIADLMQRDVISLNVTADQEELARLLAKFDFLAIPVVDREHRLLGIVTHDDVIDVVREEATEDAHRIAGVEPLRAGYLDTELWTLAWKRGLWLTILFFGALLTATALGKYEATITEIAWLVLFLPLIISTGGNSGNQSATLVITALSTGDLKLKDWGRVVRREIATGLILGGFLGSIGYGVALTIGATFEHDSLGYVEAAVVPLTLLLVVLSGTLIGSVLPLIFRRLGLDPAMMSNPFVACIVDILGIVIYMQVALAIVSHAAR